MSQTLSMRRNMQMNRTLTTTHDNAAAWTGIGSALLHAWYQKAVPASVLGVLTTTLYLADIMVLHITTPALFSVQAFNSSPSVPVSTTQSIPGWKWDISNFTDDTWTNITVYTNGASAFLPFMGSTDPVGLSNDTLYDVLSSRTLGVNTDVANGIWTIEYLDRVFDIHSTQPGLLNAGDIAEEQRANTLILYSTIPVLDSEGNNGTWIDLTIPMNSSFSTLQFFECSQSAIFQNATVDAQTGQLLATPRVDRSHSTWAPYSGPPGLDPTDPSVLNSTGIILVDAWAMYFDTMAASSISLELEVDLSPPFLSVADQYLAQKLNLLAVDQGERPTFVALHEVENALSSLVTSFLWTEIRLNLSIVAVSVVLVASIVLTVLALPFIIFQPDANGEANVSIGGTGVLHSIWLYRNHPELQTLLPQVDDPTDENLRRAGMVRTSAAGSLRRRKED
ncbi:hypothetical protein FB451DRAFT_1386225 [Mycena latifolia]|nr:hypothetical protein FB451DRAFT_1386225 [Mycena latifolia]